MQSSNNNSNSSSRIPVIDISPLLQFDRANESYRKVCGLLDAACRDTGFFYVINHGIDMSKVIPESKRVFDISPEEKNSIYISNSNNHKGYGGLSEEQLHPLHQDYKETYDMGLHQPSDGSFYGENQYPPSLGTEWRDLMDSHYMAMLQLAKTILKAFTVPLQLPSDFFEDMFSNPVAVLRFIHYPPIPNSTDNNNNDKEKEFKIVAGQHTDYGCITLLHQDSVGGLQVSGVTKDNKDSENVEWIEATPIPNSFVVNIGDMLARWTNDQYKSTLHRVVRNSRNSSIHRYSMPFFSEPHRDTPIVCLPQCQSPDNPPKYPPTTCGEHLTERFTSTYDYYGKK